MDSLHRVAHQSSHQKRQHWWRAGSASAGIFVGVMPLADDYGLVFDTIGDMTSLELGVLFLAGMWNLATYGFVLTAALPGLRRRETAVVNQASTAVSNTLPYGGAIGVGVSIAMLTGSVTRTRGLRPKSISTDPRSPIWRPLILLMLFYMVDAGSASTAESLAHTFRYAWF